MSASAKGFMAKEENNRTPNGLLCASSILMALPLSANAQSFDLAKKDVRSTG
jgi:hypothetical protein